MSLLLYQRQNSPEGRVTAEAAKPVKSIVDITLRAVNRTVLDGVWIKAVVIPRFAEHGPALEAPIVEILGRREFAQASLAATRRAVFRCLDCALLSTTSFGNIA